MSHTKTETAAALSQAERAVLIQALALIIAAADDAGCFLCCTACDTSSELGRGVSDRLGEALVQAGRALDVATSASEYEAAWEGHNVHADTQPELIAKQLIRLESRKRELVNAVSAYDNR